MFVAAAVAACGRLDFGVRADGGLGDVAIIVDAPAPANVAFVTSGTFTGNLGGLAGVDAKCNAAALSAGLTGMFVAWLSTPQTNAIDRIGSARLGAHRTASP